MAIIARVLPEDEWYRLEKLPINTEATPDPDRCVIVVAENEVGDIVGTWGLVLAPFLEGLWVDPEYRKKTYAAAKMWQCMQKTLMEFQLPQALTLTQSDDVLSLARHAGFVPLDGTLCSLTL